MKTLRFFLAALTAGLTTFSMSAQGMQNYPATYVGGQLSDQAVVPPYSINFADSQEGWTTVDKSETPGRTWKALTGNFGFYYQGQYYPCVGTENENGSAMDDYYVSPAFSLKAGKYDLSALVLVSGSTQCTLLMGTTLESPETFSALEGFTPDEDYDENKSSQQTVTIETDGTYYFALHATREAYAPGGAYVFNFNLTENNEGGEVEPPITETVEPPYEIDFSKNQEGWTAVDKSAVPGKTWKALTDNFGFYDQGQYYSCVGTENDYAADTDDYYLSPVFSLKAGNYHLSTLVLVNGTAECSLSMGTDPEKLEEFIALADLNLGDSYNESNTSNQTVTIETDGTYYFAFHATKGQYAPGTAYLFNFKLTSEEEGGEVETSTVTVPYAIDFKTSIKDWTTRDNNHDNLTWQQYSGLGVVVSIGENNDLFVSPAITLEKGKTYKIETETQGGAVNTARTNLSLLVGKENASLDVLTKSLTLPNMGLQTQSHYYSPTENGNYQFAFHLTSDNGPGDMPVYVSAFEIEVSATEPSGPEGDDVFTAKLDEGSNPADGWIFKDGNNDEHTWTAQDGKGIVYDSNDLHSSDEHAITPAIALTEGQDYLVTTTFTQSGAFDDDVVMLKAGTSPDAESMTVLTTILVTTTGGSGTFTSTNRMTATTTGDYYFDFNVVSKTGDNGELTLTEVHVTPVAKAIPCAVTEFTAKRDEEGTVTLSWSNPTLDTNELPLAGKISVKLLEDNLPLAVLEDQVPGEVGSYTYTPENALNGKVTYRAIALIGENEASPATSTINFDDVTGEKTLVYAFPVSRDNKDEWTTINVAGTSVWMYDYSNVFSFDYKVGQSNDNDWLISPSIELKADTRYIAAYELKGSLGYPCDIDVTVGQGSTAATQNQVIATHPDFDHNGFGAFESDQFSVPEDGSYHFGFHVTNAKGFASMRELQIFYINTTADGISEQRPVESIAYNSTTQCLIVPGAATVYDLQGRAVLRLTGDGTFNLGLLPTGVYTVKAVTAEGRTVTMKIAR